MRYRRQGFTLTEVLIVIGILVVLAAMLTVGIGKVANSGHRTATIATLQNAKSMLGELDRATRLSSTPKQWFPMGNPGPGVNFWHTPYHTNPLDAPGNLSVENGGRQRTEAFAVKNTVLAMDLMLKMPENKKAIGKIPANQLLRVAGNPGQPLPEAPVLLDSWGNPIIFVPSCGLRTTVAGNTVVIRSPDNRPFFASAGADADFSKGDDNIYSFEN